MKRIVLSALALLLVGVVTTRAAHAQGGVNVAVVDISQVFKNHPRFKATADQIKAEIKQFEQTINNQRKALLEQRKKLEQYTPGSPEYRKLEEYLARQASDLKLKAGLKRKEVLSKEAKLYFQTYQEIRGVISQVARQYKISLVLRFNSKPIDPNDRGDVLAGINRPVVYQQGIDITAAVLEKVGVVPGAARRSGGPIRQ